MNSYNGLHVLLKSLLKHSKFMLARPYIRPDCLPREAKPVYGILANYYKNNPADMTMAGLQLLMKGDAGMALMLASIQAAPEAEDAEIIHLAKALNKKYYLLEAARQVNLTDAATIDWAPIADKLYQEIVMDSQPEVKVYEYGDMPDTPAIQPVYSGLNSIDSIMPFPFPKGGVHMFGGRIKDGKTTFLNNLTLAMLIKGQSGAYVCREMTPGHMSLKLEAIAYNKPEAEILKDRAKYSKGLNKSIHSKGAKFYYIDGMNTSAGQLENKLDKMLLDGVKLDFIVDDYLMLMVVGNKKESRFEHDLRSREAKRLAGKFNVAYITAWQLAEDSPNYPRYKDDYSVKVSDWAESKTLVGSHPHSLWGLWSDKALGQLRLNLIAHRDYSYPWCWSYTVNKASGRIEGEYL